MGQYITRSIAVAAALKLAGIEPTEVGRNGVGKTIFFYDRTPDLTAALDGYHDGTTKVIARDFASAQHFIRATYIPR